jgi:D-methionine transport system ATP-binding protein
LLCDEATSALDPNITNSILKLLRKINNELGITMVVVTHQMNVVKQVCNEMAILSKGKLESKGKVEDIFLSKPKVLEELLGDTGHTITPTKGVNIEIIHSDDIHNKSLLANLAISTGVKYSLVWGGIDKYREKILGSFIINVEEKDKVKIINFLNEQGTEWRIA